ncbi:MAG: VOC family protein [Thermoplasmata archaeon]|nr:VOC family protein [Thermoplasmata archaeon]
MKVKGISWVGIKTDKLGELATFFRTILGLRAIREDRDFILFRLPDGDLLELFGPEGPDLPGQFSDVRVMPGFAVDDIEGAREELKAAGGELMGPLERDDTIGLAWQHFRGPDGWIYELTYDRSRS